MKLLEGYRMSAVCINSVDCMVKLRLSRTVLYCIPVLCLYHSGISFFQKSLFFINM